MSAAEIEKCHDAFCSLWLSSEAALQAASPYPFSRAKKGMKSCCLPAPGTLLAPSLQTQLTELLGVIPTLPLSPSLIIFHANDFCSLDVLLVSPAVRRNNYLACWLLYSGADPQEAIGPWSTVGSQRRAGLGLKWQGPSNGSEMAMWADSREPFSCP